jgi:hypothetical protein
MKENVQRLWTPENPVNHHLKLECLKLACTGAIKNDPKDILPAAQEMFDWLTQKGNDQRSS